MYIIHRLSELIIPWFVGDSIIYVNLKGLKLNSNDIVLGDLFIAIQGCKTDGRLYIIDAIKNGAIAILAESYSNKFLLKKFFYNGQLIPIIYFEQLNKYISNIAGRFYGDPSLYLKLIGVTGTNGKTTITHLLANWITLLGEKSAVMGTLGNGLLGNLSFSYCTTESAIDIQRILNEFVCNQIECVAMEVSSHGLDQYRVDALYFDVAIFSNLSCDHLDYHSDFNAYKIAKWRLFNELHVKHCVINADDHVGNRWLYDLPNATAVTMINNLPKFWKGRWICLIKANYYVYGTDIFFNSSWGSGIIHSKLLGNFNVSNLLLALGALLSLGYSLKYLLYVAPRLQSICGRMEVFRFHNRPIVIVDYAHTPDALKQVLIFFKKICSGHLWCIFGCGGNRDRNKRAMMGILSEKYSDYVIITNDNPRNENPRSIINDIIHDIRNSKKISIIENRSCAIKYAVSQAKSQDYVLICGKGHEKYQIIGCNYIKYSDKDVVRNILMHSM